tara:strand:- start:40434 stop:41306 length:873 start_codon:yes stop_codon:yes gene_type:complete
MIETITQRLFAAVPQDTLYHYTTMSGLLGIVGGRELRASDIRYMNDSAELRHTLDLLSSHVTQRIIAGVDNPTLLKQLLEWLSHRVVSGSLLMGASFRANGNLLSQWRGYSVHGKGVSLGFDPAHILDCAARQQFQVGKCLYDPAAQAALVEQIIDAVEQLASQQAPDHAAGEAPSWQHVFEQIEGDLLRIAAVLKHPAFAEEQEWRLVSPLITRCHEHPVRFREGHSMLVPYYAFELCGDAGLMQLEHVYLGPTNNIDLSMNSLQLYLQSCGVTPAQGISYCQIPFRQR